MTTMTLDPFADAEVLDNAPGDATGDLTCENCGNAFSHSGRGRKPKRCPDCRAKRSDVTPKSGSRGTKLKEPLADFYRGIGMLFYPFDNVCGSAVIQSADQCAASLDNLARTNPGVRRFLEGLTKTSAWGTVIAAHASLVMAIAMHHTELGESGLGGMFGGTAEGS